MLGTGDLLAQPVRCCNPVPGDGIIGYLTRSRGVTVHRRDCFNVLCVRRTMDSRRSASKLQA